MKTTQTQFVLNHLIDHGYITETVARNYNIRRLASRVHELTSAGVAVDKEFRKDDAGVRYVYYSMSPDQRAAEGSMRANGAAWNGRPIAAAA